MQMIGLQLVYGVRQCCPAARMGSKQASLAAVLGQGCEAGQHLLFHNSCLPDVLTSHQCNLPLDPVATSSGTTAARIVTAAASRLEGSTSL
jgi:hypothetical protein